MQPPSSEAKRDPALSNLPCAGAGTTSAHRRPQWASRGGLAGPAGGGSSSSDPTAQPLFSDRHTWRKSHAADRQKPLPSAGAGEGKPALPSNRTSSSHSRRIVLICENSQMLSAGSLLRTSVADDALGKKCQTQVKLPWMSSGTLAVCGVLESSRLSSLSKPRHRSRCQQQLPAHHGEDPCLGAVRSPQGGASPALPALWEPLRDGQHDFWVDFCHRKSQERREHQEQPQSRGAGQPPPAQAATDLEQRRGDPTVPGSGCLPHTGKRSHGGAGALARCLGTIHSLQQGGITSPLPGCSHPEAPSLT